MEKLNNLEILFKFESPVYEDIHNRLVLVSPSAAQYFKDACKLMGEECRLESTVNLVAHMLRETESLLREVLLPISNNSLDNPPKKKRKRKNQHLWEIRSVLKSLKFKKKDIVWVTWEDISQQQYKYAHRNSLWTTEKKDEDFGRYWDNMLLIFDQVTAKVESTYSNFFDQVDCLLSKKEPNKSDANLLARVPNNSVLLGYFFEKVDNPKWLAMLKSRQFYKHPPKAILHPDGGISYPSWPQAEYLKKIANNKSCSNNIVQIINDLDTDNARVKSEAIEVATKLPPEESIKLVDKINQWSLSIERWILPKTIGDYLFYLGENGYITEALLLAKNLLAINQKDSIDIGDTTLISSGLKIKIDDWEYQEILQKNILPLAVEHKEKIVYFLVDILNTAISINKGSNDMSTIWQPAIEKHEQNSDSEIKAILVNVLRDACTEIIDKKPNEIKPILNILEKEKRVIFHRIAIYLVHRFSSIDKEEAKKVLMNKDYFEDDYYKHEYLTLLHDFFDQLDATNQKQILDWIDNGLDFEIIKKKYGLTKKPTLKQMTQFKEVWKRNRLSFILEKIPNNKKEEYEILVKKYGKPQHPDFDFYSSGGTWGPNSPVQKEELEKKSVDEIIQLLKSWKPSKADDEKMISKDGLGRLLAEIMVSKPQEFSERAIDILNLDPAYIGSVLNGFKDSAKNKGCMNWNVILNMCLKIIEMPLDELDKQKTNPQWRWNLNTIAEMLDEAIDNNLIPWSLDRQVIKILSFLVSHPHPTTEDEEKYLNNDPVAYSMNTVRGDAFNAFIKYIGWVKKNTHENTFSINKHLEISQILNERLKDDSLSIRSIFGYNFVRLFLDDDVWVKSHIDDIFPVDNKLVFEAAWEGFIVWARPHKKLYEPLKNKYLHAVKLISEPPVKNKPLYNKNEHLSNHLMVYLWNKTIDFNDEIMIEFYKLSSLELRKHTVCFIGRILSEKESKLTKKQLSRIKEFWEIRKKSILNTKEDYSELEGFGFWAKSNRFSDKWIISEVLEICRLGINLERDSELLEVLKKDAKIFPRSIAEIIDLYIRNDEKGWNYTLNKNNIREVMESINTTSNREAKQFVKKTANLLVTKGVMEFRDLAN